MATARSTSKTRRAPAARAAGQRQTVRRATAPRTTNRTPKREQTNHGRELAGVFIIALAVFLGFVLYLGWRGGLAGHWLSAGIFWVIGIYTYAAPLLLLYVAYLVAGGRSARMPRAAAWGCAFLALALLLAGGANTFGAFGGGRPAANYASAHLHSHGGAIGELLWSGLHIVVGHFGVTVLVMFAAAAGLLLVSGSSLGLWANRSRRGVNAAGQAARRRVRALDEHRRTTFQRLREQSAAGSDEALTQNYGPAVTTHPARVLDGQHAVPEIFAGDTAGNVISENPASEDPLDDGPIIAVEDSVAEGVQLTIPTDAAAGGHVTSDETALAFAATEQREWSLPDTSVLRPLGTGREKLPTRSAT